MAFVAGLITMATVFIVEMVLLTKGIIFKNYKEKKDIASMYLLYLCPGVSAILVTMLINIFTK